jgi:hypothetical protein
MCSLKQVLLVQRGTLRLQAKWCELKVPLRIFHRLFLLNFMKEKAKKKPMRHTLPIAPEIAYYCAGLT